MIKRVNAPLVEKTIEVYMPHLIVMSADALVADDMEYLSTLPNFIKYLSGGAAVKRVRAIYPTVTYPVHVSISTGCYPERHGVISNSVFTPGKSGAPWQWFANAVKTPDIFTAAKRAGLTTAAVFWPVTGCHRDIDFLIDEYWRQSKTESFREAFARAGSSEAMLDIIDRHTDILVERRHPQADEFVVRCACDIIREHAPDVMLLHPANIDGYRHSNGVFGEHIRKGLDETDRWIGELMAAAEDAGTAADTAFFLISDHGQLDIRRVVNPNVILADHGFISVSDDGALVGWDAFIRSVGMSAYVYLKNRERYGELKELLDFMVSEGVYGVGECFTAAGIREREHVADNGNCPLDFDFMLESDDYSSIGEAYVRPIVTAYDFSDYRRGRATHGYLPDKGAQPVLYAKGAGIRNGVELERRSVVDEAPTFARVLGIPLGYECDGEAIGEILI